MAGFKVNFSDEEASSAALDFDALPSGKYYCRVTDVDVRECGPESKNAGKPYWSLEFTIQEGTYTDRKVWTNCMLFDGALYTLAQLLKATGHEKALKTGSIPDGEAFIGKEVLVNVRKQRDKYREERDGATEPLWKNEVKGISAYTEGTNAGSKSLLP